LPLPTPRYHDQLFWRSDRHALRRRIDRHGMVFGINTTYPTVLVSCSGAIYFCQMKVVHKSLAKAPKTTIQFNLSKGGHSILNDYAKRFAGRSLLREELNLTEPELNQLIEKHQLTPTDAISKHFFTNRCLRCGNTAKQFFGKIPCSNCGKTHLYCRKCIQMGRVMMCTPLYKWTGKDPIWPSFPDSPLKWAGELTPAQRKASNKIIRAIQTKQSELLVHAV